MQFAHQILYYGGKLQTLQQICHLFGRRPEGSALIYIAYLQGSDFIAMPYT